jgi:hypothetical protein
MGGTAAGMEVVRGTIPRIGEMGGTKTSIGEMGYPYRILIIKVHEDRLHCEIILKWVLKKNNVDRSHMSTIYSSSWFLRTCQ